MNRPHSLLVAALAALALALPWASTHADTEKKSQPTAELADEDAACLKCHNDPSLGKALPNGTKRTLYVSEKEFVQSVHLKDGCSACHSQTEDECVKPAKDKPPLTTKREHSLALQKGCADCHKETVQHYENSIHAAGLKKGGEKADKQAICSSCHKVHAERFFEAANKCESCHEEAVKQHRDWLPKTERHLQTIACEACHAPQAQRQVNLRLYEGQAPLTRAGVPEFKKVGPEESAGKSLDSRALWGLLKDFNQENEAKTVIRGKLEVRSPTDGHLLAEKGKAIKECKTCHHKSAEAFKSVSVSIVGPDGKSLSAPADKAILTSLQSLESVGGFYVLGATRMWQLDVLLALVALGAASVPIGHFTVRMISRRLRARREAQAKRNTDR
jgi:hypothetical protein